MLVLFLFIELTRTFVENAIDAFYQFWDEMEEEDATEKKNRTNKLIWTLVDTMPLTEVPTFFERSAYDWNVKDQTHNDKAIILRLVNTYILMFYVEWLYKFCFFVGLWTLVE
jgi:hypothetical protein